MNRKTLAVIIVCGLVCFGAGLLIGSIFFHNPVSNPSVQSEESVSPVLRSATSMVESKPSAAPRVGGASAKSNDVSAADLLRMGGYTILGDLTAVLWGMRFSWGFN